VASQDRGAGTPQGDIPDSAAESPSFDTTIPHPARIYDYWLGGKDNYEADREAAEQVIATQPSILATVRANRAFLRRAVQYLAGEAGIRQFLDIGAGLPTNENTHQIAQEIAPESRIVYVDNDPVVRAHARALLTSTTEGATGYVQADARDTSTILREAARTLDLSQPLAVMMLGLLHYIPDADRPLQIVSRLMDGVAPGSYLAISEATRDIDTHSITESAARFNARRVAAPFTPRTRAEIARYFSGLDLVAPGLVPLPQWRGMASAAQQIPAYAAIARKRPRELSPP
jgi:O-methyltransferase involved in polyketide biosynthesis